MLKEKTIIASLLVLVLRAVQTYAETIDVRLRNRNKSSDEKVITRANLTAIKQFILKKGFRETYCNMYNDNPAYHTKNFFFYLNPDSGPKSRNCETDKSDFHSLTIRNPNDKKDQYRRVEFLDKHYVYIVVTWPTKDLTVSQAREFVIKAIKEILMEIEKETPIRVTDSLLLQPPLTLVELRRWKDGGSLGFAIRDATDKRLSFCIDSQIESDTVGRWYLHATHPTHEGAKLVEEKNQTEHALKSALRVWVSQHYDEAEQSKLAISEWSDKIAENETLFNAWTIMKLLSRMKAS